MAIGHGTRRHPTFAVDCTVIQGTATSAGSLAPSETQREIGFAKQPNAPGFAAALRWFPSANRRRWGSLLTTLRNAFYHHELRQSPESQGDALFGRC